MEDGLSLIMSYFLAQNAVSVSYVWVNPLRLNSDLSQFSHCNIKSLSVSEVMRIEGEFNFIDILIASPHYVCKKCMETQKEKL